tara:strand:- start:7831 stop:8190 length:360 start_codon:yes stop_codon:yes gene_type:complete
MEENKKIWNDCFNKVLNGLKSNPIHYKDNHNLRGEVYLKELYQNSDINFDDGLDTLVDLVAYLIDKNGYTIEKKKGWVTTIRPTGPPVSIICGGTSGIIPEFKEYYFRRKKINPDETKS